MRQLRLVGIHENGSSLQVSSDDGMSFELPVDDALRSAMAEIARSRQPRKDEEQSVHSPREIQARVRGGASAYELSLEWDVPLETILKYEGPVLAERAHIVELAQRVEVSGPQTDAEYREVFGEEPADLGAMVTHRLHQLNIDTDSAVWDSYRDPEGHWIVWLKFRSPLDSDNVQKLEHAGDSEEENTARWSYNPQRKTIKNLNRWAQTLSEQVAPEYFAPIAAVSASDAPAPSQPASEPTDQELLDLLNARRGQRSNEDPENDERLNELIERGTGGFDDEDESEDSLPNLPQGFSPRTTQLSVVPNHSATQDSTGAGEQPAEEPDAAPRKPKRSSVPSWDDIMFGKRKKD